MPSGWAHCSCGGDQGVRVEWQGWLQEGLEQPGQDRACPANTLPVGQTGILKLYVLGYSCDCHPTSCCLATVHP